MDVGSHVGWTWSHGDGRGPGEGGVVPGRGVWSRGRVRILLFMAVIVVRVDPSSCSVSSPFLDPLRRPACSAPSWAATPPTSTLPSPPAPCTKAARPGSPPRTYWATTTCLRMFNPFGLPGERAIWGTQTRAPRSGRAVSKLPCATWTRTVTWIAARPLCLRKLSHCPPTRCLATAAGG